MNPYVDPATGVHYNKLGIKNAEELREAEYNATWVRGLELRASPVLGQFDFDHLKAIHKSLFQDVYAWAGEERTINFSKRVAGEPWWTTKFDRIEMMKVRMEVTGDYLKEKNFLRGLPREEFALEVAKVYTSLNAAHPMAEGNGRSTQTFLSQLATEAGHRLDFSRVDRDTWIHAAARSMDQVHVKEPGRTRPRPWLRSPRRGGQQADQGREASAVRRRLPAGCERAAGSPSAGWPEARAEP